MKTNASGFLVTVLTLVATLFSAGSPTASLIRLSGTDLAASNGTLGVLIENPSNAATAISKVTLGMGSFGDPTKILVDTVGLTSTNGLTVSFTASLKPGSSALLTLVGVANPAVAGKQSITVTAQDSLGSSFELGAKSGKSLSRDILAAPVFRSTPYARIGVQEATNNGRAGGVLVGFTNTNSYAYLLFNPYDSGSSINLVTIDIPANFRVISNTKVSMTNLLTGSALFTKTGLYSNGYQGGQTFSLPLSADLSPGEIVVVLFEDLVNTSVVAVDAVWKMTVANTNSGAVVVASNMPGFSGAQTTSIVTMPSVAGYYGHVKPWFSFSPPAMGWPTAGSVSNAYQFTYFALIPTAVNHNSLRMSNSSFNLAPASVALVATNRAGGFIGTPVIVNNSLTNSVAVNAAGSNAAAITLVGVVNPSTAGSFTFGATYSTTNVPSTNFMSATGFDRVVPIVKNLFVKTPAFGVAPLGSTGVGATTKYLLVLANPANSGDAIDSATLNIPEGFTVKSLAAEIISNLSAANSAASASVSVGSNAVNLSFSPPLGEGASVFVPVTLLNPTNVDKFEFSAVVSGKRDVDSLTASGAMTDDVGSGINTTNIISIGDGVAKSSIAQNLVFAAFPNPLTSFPLNVSFALAEKATVTVTVYDMNNRRVATLIDGVVYEAGTAGILWDGKSLSLSDVKNGLYYVRLGAVSTATKIEATRITKVVVSK